MSPLAAGSHGLGDFGVLEWALVGLGGLVTAWVIARAVRLTLRPGETDADHIKRSILDEPDTLAGRGPQADAESLEETSDPHAHG